MTTDQRRKRLEHCLDRLWEDIPLQTPGGVRVTSVGELQEILRASAPTGQGVLGQ